MIASAVDVVSLAVLPMLGLSALLAGWRVLRGPTGPDRVAGLELLTTVGVGFAAAASVVHRQDALLDASLVLALVAFVSALASARMVRRQS